MSTLLYNSLLILLYDVCKSIDLKLYNNSVLYGDEMEIVALTSLDDTIIINDFKYSAFSAKIEGTISWLNNVDKYYFDCNWDPQIMGFLWIDDHLICAPGIYEKPVFAFWNLTWTLSANTKRKSFIRINIYSQIVNMSNHIVIPFNIKWSFNNNNTFVPINNTFLSAATDKYQQMRLLHQENLINNTWSQWYFTNLLTIVRLPDSLGFTIGGCTSSTDCQMNAIVENNDLRVGVKSIDLQNSYFEYNFTYKSHLFQYEYATVIDDDDGISNLYVMIKYLGDPTKTVYVGVNTRFYWYRKGIVDIIHVDSSVDASAVQCGAIKAIPYGLNKTWYLCSNQNPSSHINSIDALTFKVTANNPIYFTTNTVIKNVSQISNIINHSKQKEYLTYNKYANLSETKLAIQAGLMWNLIYTPEESVIAPVSRAWSSANMPNGWDFDFILFDWDNIFASYMLSLDALNISISNLIQIIKAKTVHGFIPNYKTIHYPRIDSSEDRSEPMIGAMVLHEMYLKYGDQISWLIQLLFDDLYDWTDFFWRRRRCAPKNLICLGSDPNQPDFNNNENNMQAARYESGLDNSPMYDGNFYDASTHHMLLYDVGMTAMFMNEVKCLMNLGKAINVNVDIINILNERYEFMANATMNELWDESMNIFINKFSQNDSFYRRISPTSFYPLMTGIATIKQAEIMVSHYLLNPDYFCISLIFPINQSSDCYYGLPSISHNDPAFSNGYWRGLVWGPMAQLVWWSLEAYSNQSDIVKNGQIALQNQMNAMMLKIWNDKRHICENFSPSSKNDDCTGTQFYHWGGLTGFLSLIHPYYQQY